MTRQQFDTLTTSGVVLWDGATGSNLRAAGMPVGVSPELWVLEHPQLFLDLQRAYVEAGSQLLCAPTFSANRRSLENFGLEDRVKELNGRLLRLSRDAAGGQALVCADVSTMGQPLEPLGSLPYTIAYDVYREQIEALAEAGADLIAGETLMGIDEAVALLDAASGFDLPVLCSFSAEADGGILFGGNVREAALTLQELGTAAVGVNCSVGPDQLESVVRGVREAVQIPVIAKPNAGLPTIDELGRAHYDMDAERFAQHMLRLIKAGAGLVGGCCGTTPAYIRKLAEVMSAYSAEKCT